MGIFDRAREMTPQRSERADEDRPSLAGPNSTAAEHPTAIEAGGPTEPLAEPHERLDPLQVEERPLEA